MPSDTVLRIAGLYIEDEAAPKPPVLDWIQAECRNGKFTEALHEAAKDQIEMLRVDLAVVESASESEIVVKVPGCVCDHESNHPFPTDVLFSLNPVSRSCTRL
jgi:hypothetical protein